MRKNLTKIEFVERAKIKHNGSYDYSLSEYHGTHIPVEIICSTHGIFSQKPTTHLSGRKCPKCSISKKGPERKWDTDTLKGRLKEISPQYDYSLLKFENYHKNVIVICSTHGKFGARIANLLKGSGCRECNRHKVNVGKDEIIKRAHAVHGNKFKYDLLKEDITLLDKASIVCPLHGKFQQKVDAHLRGKNCPGCSKKNLPFKQNN